MDKDRFPMTASREPNPLRPYYIPPSIDHAPGISPSQTPHAARSSIPNSGPSISSSARDLLPDLDLDLKTTTSEAWQHTRRLFDTLAWRYFSVVLAQPFDVSKTILQVAAPPSNATNVAAQRRSGAAAGTYSSRSSRSKTSDNRYSDDEDEVSDDQDRESDGIPDYFSATAPRSRSPRKRRRTPPVEDLSPSPTPRPMNRREQGTKEEYKITIKKPAAIMNAIGALYDTSGAVGLWRASNTTFLYSILLRTTDSFIRSILLTILGLPDIIGPDQGGLAPGLITGGGAGFNGIDLSDSPNPIGSLIVVGLASCLTGLLLAPLDMVRTRLIVTPISTPPRGLVQNLRRLPSLLAPSNMWLPTALYHAIPNIFSAATPLVLRRQLRVTPELTPSLWSLAAFTTSLTELFIRLPLETVVRRAQVSALKAAQPDVLLIVDTAPYVGVWGTVYSIMYVEGETTTKAANGMLRTRRGQGMAGLVRGWRVGFWGLVGVWGAGALGPADAKGKGEF